MQLVVAEFAAADQNHKTSVTPFFALLPSPYTSKTYTVVYEADLFIGVLSPSGTVLYSTLEELPALARSDRSWTTNRSSYIYTLSFTRQRALFLGLDGFVARRTGGA